MNLRVAVSVYDSSQWILEADYPWLPIESGRIRHMPGKIIELARQVLVLDACLVLLLEAGDKWKLYDLYHDFLARCLPRIHGVVAV